MSRKRRAVPRKVLPDPFFFDEIVTKFINGLMKNGKRSVAEKIFYDVMKVIEEKTKDEPIKLFRKAMSNVKPAVEVKSRRIGGTTYQIPVEVRPDRRQSLAIRWIRDHARARSGKSMVEKLTDELMDCASSRGGAFKKREDIYKMAEANKAFAHFKW